MRTLSIGSTTEGCVADDVTGDLYIAEEDVAIWKYGAEPDAGRERTRVDGVGSGGHLTADIEGLAIYYRGDGGGYLLASSQGSDAFVVYERGGDNAYVTTFAIDDGAVDGVSHTDGLDVTNAGLGTAFPDGLFVAQDDRNDGGNQNFKLVPWGAIARAVESGARHRHRLGPAPRRRLGEVAAGSGWGTVADRPSRRREHGPRAEPTPRRTGSDRAFLREVGQRFRDAGRHECHHWRGCVCRHHRLVDRSARAGRVDLCARRSRAPAVATARDVLEERGVVCLGSVTCRHHSALGCARWSCWSCWGWSSPWSRRSPLASLAACPRGSPWVGGARSPGASRRLVRLASRS